MQKRCDHKLHIQYIVLFYSYFIFILYSAAVNKEKKILLFVKFCQILFKGPRFAPDAVAICLFLINQPDDRFRNRGMKGF